ncbi:MAG: SRPBCC family protein [Jatrophihabitantaceae bacterium]
MTDSDASQDAVVIERTIDAPVEVVWQMWTEPDHFAAWYGPSGATIPVARMDVRVGGNRLVCMQMDTPRGVMRMWFAGEYREVIANRRLVYTEAISDEYGHVMSAADSGLPDGHPITTVVTVELHETPGRTTMVITHVGVPADSAGAVGWTVALDKLTALVGTQPR